MYIYVLGDLFNEDQTRQISHEEKIALIKKCQAIFNAIMDEGDLGEYTLYVGQYNEFLAREYAALGKKEETLHHFEKAVDGWVAYSQLPTEYEYKNILMTHRPYTAESVSGQHYDLERYKNDINNNSDFDFVRNDEWFKAAYKKLCNE